MGTLARNALIISVKSKPNSYQVGTNHLWSMKFNFKLRMQNRIFKEQGSFEVFLGKINNQLNGLNTFNISNDKHYHKKYFRKGKAILYSSKKYWRIEPSVPFFIEISHLICNENQTTGLYLKYNTGLKLVHQSINTNSGPLDEVTSGTQTGYHWYLSLDLNSPKKGANHIKNS